MPIPYCSVWLEKGDCPRGPDCKQFHWAAEQVKQYNSLGPLYIVDLTLNREATAAARGASSDESPGGTFAGAVASPGS